MSLVEFTTRYARHIKSIVKKLKNTPSKPEFVPVLHNIILVHFLWFALLNGPLLEAIGNCNLVIKILRLKYYWPFLFEVLVSKHKNVASSSSTWGSPGCEF